MGSRPKKIRTIAPTEAPTSPPTASPTSAPTATPFTDATIVGAKVEWFMDYEKAEAKYGNIKNWDVSKVTKLRNFFQMTSFNGCDILEYIQCHGYGGYVSSG